jgi:anti-sigma-K factor RskA
LSSDPRAARGHDHATFDELAVGWALHALEPEDEAVFARHLPDCARCARTVAETFEVMGAMATDLPAAEPSPELRDRLRAAVEQTEQLPALPDLAVPADADDAGLPVARAVAGPPRPSPARRATGFPFYEPRQQSGPTGAPTWRRMMPSALVAAAVAAILALGSWAVVLGDQRQQAQTAVAEQSAIMNSLLQAGHATIAPVADRDGHTVATVVARNGQVQVVTTGLSINNSARSTYVVWGMQDDSPVALGTFDVVSPQTDLRTVGSDSTGLDGYNAYAISLEPGRQAPTTPSDVIANGQVTS